MLRMNDSRTRAGVLALLVVGTLSAAARANPRPLPFTYQAETLPKGTVEVEQFVDLVPVRAASFQTGNAIWFLASQFQTEFEVGLTDRLELGLYVSFVPQPNPQYVTQTPSLFEGNGVKQRLRYHLADPETWPIDVSLYGEVTENEREIELEGKIILQRRVGRVRFITNLWAEHELYLDGHREWVLNPTLGVTAELSPRYHLGAEGWWRAEYRVDRPAGTSNLMPAGYVGPAFMANFGKLWWSTGAYVRVTDIDRPLEVADNSPNGHFWFRSIVGLSF
jgi:hypothetical protein